MFIDFTYFSHSVTKREVLLQHVFGHKLVSIFYNLAYLLRTQKYEIDDYHYSRLLSSLHD